MSKVILGKIHGRTIELNDELGFPEGQEVEVSVRTAPTNLKRVPGQGLLRTEGALADDLDWDEIMKEVYEERKKDARREIVE